MAPGGALYEAINQEWLAGVMTGCINFRDKGDVSSVFVVDYTGGDIRRQNCFRTCCTESASASRPRKASSTGWRRSSCSLER